MVVMVYTADIQRNMTKHIMMTTKHSKYTIPYMWKFRQGKIIVNFAYGCSWQKIFLRNFSHSAYGKVPHAIAHAVGEIKFGKF